MASAQPWWWGDAAGRQLVYRYKLAGLMRADPDRALAELDRLLVNGTNRDDIASLAELRLRSGDEREKANPEKSLGDYLAAASASYRYLAQGDAAGATNRGENRFVSLYNRATAGSVQALQRLPGGLFRDRTVSLAERTFHVHAEAQGDSLGDAVLDRWVPARDWAQIGLDHHYKNDGIGATLIASRTNGQASPLELHQPDEGIVQPATALLRFSVPADSGTNKSENVTLAFYDPLLIADADLGGRVLPLAADYTMPWAVLLSRAHALSKSRWRSLFRPGETARPHRLYLMEPYSADRIPIIMVHGMRSTPLAWLQLTNELLGDPEIRKRYQIWHYLYPTGYPFLTSAALFREDIEEVRQMLDPQDRDYATHHMVVIGHSMGGLLARTLVTDSGDVLWDSTFAKPISAIDPRQPQLSELRRSFYFQVKPYVDRVIFIAVPHRGTKKADGFLGRFVAGRVRLPEDAGSSLNELEAAVPGILKPETTAWLEAGHANALMTLADLPIAATVPFHSIMGDRGLGGGTNSSDGLVSYASAHLPGAASELIVPAWHGACGHPQTIAEVKRILRLNLAKARGPGDP